MCVCVYKASLLTRCHVPGAQTKEHTQHVQASTQAHNRPKKEMKEKKRKEEKKIKCQMKGDWHDMKEFACSSSLVMETRAKVTGSSSFQSLQHPAKAQVSFLAFRMHFIHDV